MVSNYLTIVSGLPRSGTSMMMQMLDAGGIPAMADEIREADVDNPRGYFEFEVVKATRDDASWLEESAGKVVKMVYRLLYDLPQDRSYRVVFMRRELGEVVASQKKMLERLGKPQSKQDDEGMADLFRRQLADFEKWVEGQDCLQILYVNYRDMIEDAQPQVARIKEFLGRDLDTSAMADVVTPSLYRNRS